MRNPLFYNKSFFSHTAALQQYILLYDDQPSFLSKDFLL